MPPPPPFVTVVVVNWNGLEDTRACIRSLLAQTFEAREIVVVDNGSEGDDADRIAAEFGDSIRLVRHADNRGFTGGNNAAMQLALDEGRSEFVALLNNDAEAEPDWLAALVRAASEAPDVAACTSLMVFHADPSVVENTGTEILATGEAVPRGRGRPAAEFANHPADVLGACGGAVLYRASTLRRLGLFRDDFFANFEDVDLSLRIAAAGLRCRFVPGAVVRHRLNASIQKVRDDAFRIRSVRNLTLAVWGNLPWTTLVLNAPALVVSHLLVPLVAPLLGQWDLARILVRGRLAALRDIPSARRAIRPHRRPVGLRLWWRQRGFVGVYVRFVLDVVVRRRRRYME